MPHFPKLHLRQFSYGLLAAVAVLGFLAILLVEAISSREREIHFAESNLRILSRVLERHARATVEKIDVVLQAAVHELRPVVAGETQPREPPNLVLAEILARIPESQSLRVVNAEGNVIFDASGTPPKGNIADRAYFQRNKNDRHAGLVISEPIFARFTGNWVITLSRRLETRSGEFLGLIQAAVRIDHFQDFYKTLAVGDGALISLFDSELRLIARNPALPEKLGSRMQGSQVEQLLAQGTIESVYESVSPLDGINRIYSFRRLENLPFVLLVGLTRESILAEWSRKVWLFGAAALLLSAMLLAIVALSTMAIRRNERNIADLTQAHRARATTAKALRLLTDCNILLARADDEHALLNDICRLVVESGGYSMAWVGVPEGGAAQAVCPVACCGYGKGYLESIHVSWADTCLGRGPAGAAIGSGTTQVHRNWLNSPLAAPWREPALQRDYRSCLGLPLITKNGVLGALTIYSPKADAFGADEVGLLEELARNLAFGIETQRTRVLRKQAEKELDDYRLHLERLVEQRTADLAAAKEQAEAARSEAERANNAKSRFLAAASHDLRQPLAAMSLYADVMRTKIADADRPLLDNLRECIGSLNALLRDLLDLSKLDAGVIAPQVADFPIADVLTSVVSVHTPEAQLKGLRLRCVPSRLFARTDPVLFQRMLGNLISNAVRYTECGSVLVGCRRRHGKLWVEVWDTGIGIPDDRIEEIFEEFRQLDEARSRGSGLGLAIVAKTADLLGLQVRVRSWFGRGSMFAIEIPSGTRSSVQPAPTPEPRSLRIALAEDNAYVRHALVEALRSAGHDVVAAPSGERLSDRLDGRPPDVVVSDYRLAHGETGFEVITSLREAFGKALPAVLITGDTDPGLMRSMADRGIVVQHKPLQIEVLLACILGLVAEDTLPIG